MGLSAPHRVDGCAASSAFRGLWSGLRGTVLAAAGELERQASGQGETPTPSELVTLTVAATRRFFRHAIRGKTC